LSIAGNASAASPQTPLSPVQGQIDKQLKDHPGGHQVGAYEVVYNGGKVRVVFPDPATGAVPTSTEARPEMAPKSSVNGGITPAITSYQHGCPYNSSTRYYCFYQDASWGGRMLEFQDCSSGGTAQHLTDYGFGNMTTSWVNTRGSGHGFINVNDDAGGNLWDEWTATTISQSSNVGTAANDKADWFICYS
jgi:hypothetical protein